MNRTLVCVVAACCALARCQERPSAPPLVLATTTSVGNSGLLEVLLPAFERTETVRVATHLVGSGLALKMLAAGDADVTITHAPATETEILRTHPSWQYRKVMFNRFVLVGPPTDPAHIRGSPNAAEAMRRIARSSSRFISRGDRSGTHEREQQLWGLAGLSPSRENLIVAGAGMGATLRIASQTEAYTLTDRATFAQLAKDIELVVLFESGSELLNTYAVTFDTGSRRVADARRFADWLSDGDGRRVIESFRIGQEPAFLLWPRDRPRDSPGNTPR